MWDGRSHRLLRRLSTVLAIGVLATGACSPGGSSGPAGTAAVAEATPPTTVASIDAELALACFDQAWETVSDNHFDTEYNGVDWNAVRDELRPRAAAATSNGELREIISDMLSRLDQSHFGLIPQEAQEVLASDDDDDDDAGAEDGDAAAGDAGGDDDDGDDDDADDFVDSDKPGYVGIAVRVVDDQVLVIRVDPGSPADKAGVRAGWAVHAIGKRPVSELLELMPSEIGERMAAYQTWQMINYRLEGSTGSRVRITFLDENDAEVEIRLRRTAQPGEVIEFMGLPPIATHLSADWLDIDDNNDARIGVIRFNIWLAGVKRPFDEAVDRFRDADGIIIDIRGNPGGLGFMVTGIGGHFFEEKISLGEMTTRTSELRFLANPQFVGPDGRRVQPYDGPVAIIVDGLSASTSEVFAAGLQETGRARIFGTTSVGAALPAAMKELPNGDTLMYAIADFTGPSGESVEGRGVIPDEQIKLTRTDLLAGRDSQLEAAARWIADQN